MTDGPAESPISVTLPTGLPPQACAPARSFGPASPSMPATFSTRVTVIDPPAAGSSRLSRSQRLLLAGAAVTGLWLLGSLGHPAAAHAEAAVRPAAPPVSTVSTPLTRLPAGPPLALSRPAIRMPLAGWLTAPRPRRIAAPIAHRIRARVLPMLPAAGLPAPNGLPGLPALPRLPMPGSLPAAAGEQPSGATAARRADRRPTGSGGRCRIEPGRVGYAACGHRWPVRTCPADRRLRRRAHRDRAANDAGPDSAAVAGPARRPTGPARRRFGGLERLRAVPAAGRAPDCPDHRLGRTDRAAGCWLGGTAHVELRT